MRDLLRLLEPKPDAEMEALIQEARRLTLQRFGRTIQLYAPLYLSNECIDVCTYCGFSLENRIVRKTLSVDEVCAEAEFLIGQRFRHLLLVSGEHPAHVSVDYLEMIAQRLRPRLASLSIETAPFRETDYRRLREEGVDGVVIYQETYNRARYEEVHRAGPKKNYDRRVAAIEEAAKAGIPMLGVGILLGLSDWREDAVGLADHLRRLRKKYWQSDFTISLPRLRPCAGGTQAPFPVSDRDFFQLIAALRIAFPEVGINLSTRESPALRDFLTGMGVTRMSAGSRTNPGGYTLATGGEESSAGPETTPQFEIEDQRTADQVSQTIVTRGFEPVWKDWFFI